MYKGIHRLLLVHCAVFLLFFQLVLHSHTLRRDSEVESKDGPGVKGGEGFFSPLDKTEA